MRNKALNGQKSSVSCRHSSRRTPWRVRVSTVGGVEVQVAGREWVWSEMRKRGSRDIALQRGGSSTRGRSWIFLSPQPRRSAPDNEVPGGHMEWVNVDMHGIKWRLYHYNYYMHMLKTSSQLEIDFCNLLHMNDYPVRYRCIYSPSLCSVHSPLTNSFAARASAPQACHAPSGKCRDRGPGSGWSSVHLPAHSYTPRECLYLKAASARAQCTHG